MIIMVGGAETLIQEDKIEGRLYINADSTGQSHLGEERSHTKNITVKTQIFAALNFFNICTIFAWMKVCNYCLKSEAGGNFITEIYVRKK